MGNIKAGCWDGGLVTFLTYPKPPSQVQPRLAQNICEKRTFMFLNKGQGLLPRQTIKKKIIIGWAV